MSTMNRFFAAASILLGGLLLSSCFPRDPILDGPGPYPDPYAQGPQNGQAPGYPYNNPPQGPGVDPYGSPPPQQSPDPYGNPGPQAQNAPAPQDPQPPAQPPGKPKYPMAEKTKNPNEVTSPYPPYNVIDVTGFKSGQLAKDPSNKKIFVVP